MESSDEESLADMREHETLGEARKRRALGGGSKPRNGSKKPRDSGHHGRNVCGGKGKRHQPSAVTKGSSSADQCRKSGQLVPKSNNGTAAKRKRGGINKGNKGKGKGKEEEKLQSGYKRGSRRSTVTGLLGFPIHWNEDDSDYDDTEDETYKPSSPSFGNASPIRTRNTASSSRTARGKGMRERNGKRMNNTPGRGGQRQQGFPTKLSTEVVLNGIVRPYLGVASKCALQRTCKSMRQLVDMPESWQSLDLRACVIGRRTMRSGRRSILSNQPLFSLARSVVQQSRFSRLTAVDLRGLNLGAMGSPPDLLVTLFKACRNLTKLNLWRTFVEHETLPQPDSAVEKAIADHLPGVEHLALEMDASNKGIKILLEGCTRLRSLHIGSRSNRRGDSVSMYPNDLGMKVFATIGAPCLETLSLVDKINIGAPGLGYILNVSSCPQLKSLILIRSARVNDRCIKAIAPEMDRITSLTLDQCPIKPATVGLVVERCLQLSRLVICTRNGVLEKPQEGRPLLDLIFTRCSAKLTTVDIQRVLPGDPSNEVVQGVASVPSWLKKDAVLHNTVVKSTLPRIMTGFVETPDDRVSRFMKFAPLSNEERQG